MTVQIKHSFGTIEFTRSGNAYLISESKKIKKDIFIPRGRTGEAFNGDTVFVALKPGRNEGETIGQVIGVKKRFRPDYVGVFDKDPVSGSFVVKAVSKKFPIEFVIPKLYIGTAKIGDKVLVKLSKWDKKKNKPIGLIKQILGQAGLHSTEMKAILLENNIDSTFPKSVLDEAEKISFTVDPEEIANREDFRSITTFTIDPKDAKDFDDALSFRKLSENLYEIGVHIADVSHYMKPGSELDKEAYRRSTSTYLVDRCIPMLPERLSNGVCSLRPNEEKLCFSVIFNISTDSLYSKVVVMNTRFAKTVILSGKRYSYEEAQNIIENNTSAADSYDWSVINMNNIAKKLRNARFERGAVSFEKREVKFVLDEDGSPTGVYFKESKDSNKLIEEFMLLANQAVAKHIGEKNLPCIYRTHALPSFERLQELSIFVEQFGYSLKISEDDEANKDALNKLLMEVKGSNHANIIETVAVRSMSKAIYTTAALGHYGLGFKYYSHFTSPIRRYPDVILHRLLEDLMLNGTIVSHKLQEQCEHCSELEGKAAKAERDSIKFKQAEFMQNKIGQIFNGVVSGVSNWGLHVEVKENGVEGMVDTDEMISLNYVLDEKNYKFINSNSSKISLGDNVKVKVNGVNLTKRQIDLSLVL
jgi:ribonuclease R